MEQKLTKEQIAEIRAEEDDYITNRLIMVHMCMCFSQNLMNEVVEMIKKQGRFRYGLKNTLRNVKREINEMLGQFFDKIDAEATDEYVEGYEILDNELRIMGKLKEVNPDNIGKSREAQFNEYWFAEHTLPPTTADIIYWADRN